jgi:glycosyltransferase involved in cell wall biosynthesis
MRSVRILVWHGWLLEGSGSNVATARIVEVWRAAGHDVLLLCQERHPQRYPWIDAHGTVDRDGPSELEPNTDASSAPGRCVLLRPEIGTMLPVFVVDHYEGFETVRPFIDLADGELDAYLRANVEALQAAAGFHDFEIAFVGHGIPGAAIGCRALGSGRYVAKIHGSDLEYAIRPQERYRELAREGLEAAHAVVGPSIEALERCAGLVPEMRALARVVPPGVDVAAFRPRPRVEALREVASLLDDDPDTIRGRPASLDAEVERALESRDDKAIAALFDTYDEDVPEPDAAARLRRLAGRDALIVGYLGKLIPQKGAEHLLEAQPALGRETAALVVGFGSDRDWLAALMIALRAGDRPAVEWLRDVGGLPVDPLAAPGPGARVDVTFTGLLDHRYAPSALAAMDVQVVPSILKEAFGMVAAEGAASGALPMVARHSGLAEVAGALETDVGRPGLFSFEPGEGAVQRLAEGIDRLLSLPDGERDELRRAVTSFVATHWTWERTAAGLIDAAGPAR